MFYAEASKNADKKGKSQNHRTHGGPDRLFGGIVRSKILYTGTQSFGDITKKLQLLDSICN